MFARYSSRDLEAGFGMRFLGPASLTLNKLNLTLGSSEREVSSVPWADNKP